MIIGIDPGKDGAIAFLASVSGNLLVVKDMPTLKIKVGKTMRSRVSPQGFYEMIKQSMATNHVEMVIIEKVQGMTGDAAASSFTFGYAAGMVYGIIVGFGLPVSFVTPQAWKKSAGLGADKSLALQRAQQLWPDKVKLFSRKMDADRAEAALIARHYFLNRS
jgi:crossover junction endodeoxyribonuclease RuvC